MKTGGFLFVVTGCFLLMPAISLADDQKRVLVDVDLHQGKPVSDRSLNVSQPISFLPVKPSPTTSRNHGLAAIGGPAKTTKSTAVINGTTMKREP